MSNDTLLREVDEELRSDRMRKLWRQTAPLVIGAAVGVVLLVAGFEGWSWWTSSNASRSSDQFYAAIEVAEGSDVAAAKAALDEVIAQGTGAYPVLAQFRQASLLAQDGDIRGAVAAYDALANSAPSNHLRELALVMGANLLVDGGDVAAVQQRVSGSIAPESPMRNAAREVLGLAQYKGGQLDAAMVTFQEIVDDPLSSQEQRSLVQIYIQQLVAEGATVPGSDLPAEDMPADAPDAPPAEATPDAAAEVSSPAS